MIKELQILQEMQMFLFTLALNYAVSRGTFGIMVAQPRKSAVFPSSTGANTVQILTTKTRPSNWEQSAVLSKT